MGAKRLAWAGYVFWTPAVVTGLVAGIPVICLVLTDVYPRVNAQFLYDASISYPFKEAIMLSAIFLPISYAIAISHVVVAEWYLLRDAPLSKQHRIANTVQAILYLLCAFTWEVFIQQCTALLIGKPRPSYIDVCKPPEPVIVAGAPYREQMRITPSDCTASRELMADQMKSFPSGHAGAAVVVTGWGLAYLAHTLVSRRPPHVATGAKGQIMQDLSMSALAVWYMLVIMYIGWVCASRYYDNHHHIEDLMAGVILGSFLLLIWMWLTVYAQQWTATRFARRGRAATAADASGVGGGPVDTYRGREPAAADSAQLVAYDPKRPNSAAAKPV